MNATATFPADSTAPAARRPRRQEDRRHRSQPPRRFLGRAGVLLLVMWVPAALGGLGAGPFASWAVACGYLGIGWLLPGVLIGAAVREFAREHGIGPYRTAGLAAAALAALLLLLATASLIGT